MPPKGKDKAKPRGLATAAKPRSSGSSSMASTLSQMMLFVKPSLPKADPLEAHKVDQAQHTKAVEATAAAFAPEAILSNRSLHYHTAAADNSNAWTIVSVRRAQCGADPKISTFAGKQTIHEYTAFSRSQHFGGVGLSRVNVGVQVTRSFVSHPPGSNRSWSGGAARIALCVPCLHGGAEPSSPMLSTPTGIRWLGSVFMEHYRKLGIAHAYLHTVVAQFPALPTRLPHSFHHVAWLNNCSERGQETWALSIHNNKANFCYLSVEDTIRYWGQVWVLNDCIHRAHANGFSWVLSLDVDELLTFAPPTTLPSYIWKKERSARGEVNGITFGSNREPDSRGCPRSGVQDGHLQPPVDPTCRGGCTVGNKRNTSCAQVCTGSSGHRKHLVFTPDAVAANIHDIEVCAPACHVFDESTEVAWLRHVQIDLVACTST